MFRVVGSTEIKYMGIGYDQTPNIHPSTRDNEQLICLKKGSGDQSRTFFYFRVHLQENLVRKTVKQNIPLVH